MKQSKKISNDQELIQSDPTSWFNMEGLKELLEVGKDLGLSGKEYLDFIDKERKREEKREKKRLEREKVKDEIHIERKENKRVGEV